MLNNLFEAEALLISELETIVDRSRIFTDEELSYVKVDMFKPMVAGSRSVVAIQYDGFEIPDTAGNAANQLIEIRYRVIVVAPTVDKMDAGMLTAEILKLLSGKKLDKYWRESRLIKDVREFNAAQYGDGMVAIPALFSFKQTLR
jgi:hypothetical protein